jgi:hypothetical protein
VNIYEAYGHKEEQCGILRAQCHQMLDLLRKLKGGSIPLERIEVYDDGFRLLAVESTNGEAPRTLPAVSISGSDESVGGNL